MRRLGAAIGIVALVLAACGETTRAVEPGEPLAEIIATASPGTVLHLEAGSHSGPIVVDRPVELVAEPGAVVTGVPGSPAVLVASNAVTLRDLVVSGGDTGIHVVDSVDVVLEGVEVRGSQWHGILVDDSSVTVTDCLVWGLEAELAQGLEIRNADGRPESLVQGCRIEGPLYEGLVAHVSHVRFIDNVVVGSRERGVYITEMSDGRMEGNTVANSQGAAFFCGDMSRCTVVDNMADGIGSGKQGQTSGGGHGVVVHAQSAAFIDGLAWDDLAGDPVMVMLEGEVVGESLYP